jgi:hypothetical protein
MYAKMFWQHFRDATRCMLVSYTEQLVHGFMHFMHGYASICVDALTAISRFQ